MAGFIDIRDSIREELITALGVHKIKGDEVIFKTCPHCGNDRFNFQVNIQKKISNCWVCSKGMHLTSLCRMLHIELDTSLMMASAASDYNQAAKPIIEVVEPVKKHGIELPKEYKVRLRDYTIDDFQENSYEQQAYQYLFSRNFSYKDIAKYDVYFWKGRVLFPFYDILGELVFWTGRSFLESVKPKYLHAEISRKNVIIKYNGTSEAIYLVEGVFDAIELNKSNKEVMIILGSMFTDEQLIYLRKTERKIILCLDSDMTTKQLKLQNSLKEYLGQDKVHAFYMYEGDIAECGLNKNSGDYNLKGYVAAKLKDGIRVNDFSRFRKTS